MNIEDKTILLIGNNENKLNITVKNGSLLNRFLLLLDNHIMYKQISSHYKNAISISSIELKKIQLYIDDSYKISQVIGIYNLCLDNNSKASSLVKVVENIEELKNMQSLKKLKNYRHNVIAHTNKNFNTIKHKTDKDLQNIKLISNISEIDKKEYKDIDLNIDDIVQCLNDIYPIIDKLMKDLLNEKIYNELSIKIKELCSEIT